MKLNETTNNLTEAQKRVTTLLARDEANYLNAQLIDLELAASKRQYGNVWKIVGHISSKPKQPVKVRKADGSLPSSKEEILAEWGNYFSTLLNNKNQFADPSKHPLPSPDLPGISTGPIARWELDLAIKSLKKNRT